MKGMAAVRQVLVADAALAAIVPGTRIVVGEIAIDASLPSISITMISSVDMNIPSPASTRFRTDRVQVTAICSDIIQRETVISAVRKAAADKRPTVSGITGVTIHTDGRGPNVEDDDASIYYGFQDFLVKFSEPT